MAKPDEGPSVDELRRMIRAVQILTAAGQEAAAREAVRMFSSGLSASQMDGFCAPADKPQRP